MIIEKKASENVFHPLTIHVLYLISDENFCLLMAKVCYSEKMDKADFQQPPWFIDQKQIERNERNFFEQIYGMAIVVFSRVIFFPFVVACRTCMPQGKVIIST